MKVLFTILACLSLTSVCWADPTPSGDASDKPASADDTKPELVKVETYCPRIVTRIMFQPDSIALSDASRNILDEVAAVMEDNPQITLLALEGHAADGEIKHSIDISEQRADAVRDALIERGVEAKRLRSIGYGDTQPLDTNRTAAGRTRNRRVEFRVLEKDGQPVEE